MELDAVVIGGGAAGLAAARELSRAGLRFALLEARARLGGRMWTVRARGRAVELGAEFVHGRPPATLSALRSAGLRALPMREARGEQADDFSDIEEVFDRLNPKGPDESFASAVAAMRGVTPSQAARAREFVEGFHAADVRVIGVRELAQEKTQGAERSSRVPEGYGALVAAMAAEIEGVARSAVVREIRWSPGRVRVRCARGGRPGELTARAAVVTLPLGVLKARGAGAVRFIPPLPKAKRRALSFMRMGVVAKVGMLFKAGAWREVSRIIGDGFLREAAGSFGVYWTANPLATPLVTAWAGGPRAKTLCRLGARRAEAEAVRGLSRALGMDERRLRAGLESVFFHDWQADPFSRGAYSYVAAGGGKAREELARPLEKTLFFAGEACDSHGQSGTVAGALDSGARAGRAAVAALKPFICAAGSARRGERACVRPRDPRCR